MQAFHISPAGEQDIPALTSLVNSAYRGDSARKGWTHEADLLGGQRIDRQGIAVRAGTHCVMPLLDRFNVTATCRASFGMYNTREEVDQLAQALIKARELFA